MAITTTLKRAPKWAWLTAGGLALGAGATKLWRDRDKPPGEGSTDSPASQGVIPVVGGGSPGVIVPPVIIGGNGDDGSSNIVPLMDLFTGAIMNVTEGWQGVAGGWQDVAQGWGQVYGPVAELLPSLVIANAGGPPNGDPQVHLTVNVPPPAAPTSQPAPRPGSGPAPCPPAFPNRNPANGLCYAKCGHDECNNHKRRRDHGHCYPNGRRVHISYEALPGRC